MYLRGFRDGSDEKRVELLKKAILFLAAKDARSAKGMGKEVGNGKVSPRAKRMP